MVNEEPPFTAEQRLERGGRGEAINREQLGAAMPGARVDPASVAKPARTLGAEDCAVHGGEKPVAVRVDLGIASCEAIGVTAR